MPQARRTRTCMVPAMMVTATRITPPAGSITSGSPASDSPLRSLAAGLATASQFDLIGLIAALLGGYPIYRHAAQDVLRRMTMSCR